MIRIFKRELFYLETISLTRVHVSNILRNDKRAIGVDSVTCVVRCIREKSISFVIGFPCSI
jgi:hypothetical protein